MEEKTIGNKLKQLRLTKKLTQEKAAKELFISRGALSNYECNKRQPDNILLQRIAQFYGVDIGFIMKSNIEEQEINEYYKHKLKAFKQLTEDGYLDISGFTPLEQMEIISYYEYVRIRKRIRKKEQTGT